MSYFRISYDGYYEGEFDSIDHAVDKFLDHLENSVVGRDLTIEEWNTSSNEWEDSN